MAIVHWIILALWFVFLAYWAIAAIGVKRNIVGTPWWKRSSLRLSFLVLVIVVLSVPALHRVLRPAQAREAGSVLMGAIGAALVALGLGLAVCARTYLGRNWGSPMSRKEDAELVTGGPYASIRHPIYTGIILAMLGTTIGEGIDWLLPLVLTAAYLIYSARREEEFMCQKFGERYQAYMLRTKMIVPFVL